MVESTDTCWCHEDSLRSPDPGGDPSWRWTARASAARSAPWVCDLAEVAQGLVHLSQALLPDVVRPLGEDAFDLGVGRLGDPSSPGGQPYQSGTTVGGIGDALHVAGCLQLLDQEGRALLGDPGLLGEVGDPGAVRADPSRHACLRQRDVGEAASDHGVEGPLLQCPISDEEKDAELTPLTLVTHGAILDRLSV
jgi:hypothetical protein